jgi:hypothetical protein
LLLQRIFSKFEGKKFSSSRNKKRGCEENDVLNS